MQDNQFWCAKGHMWTAPTPQPRLRHPGDGYEVGARIRTRYPGRHPGRIVYIPADDDDPVIKVEYDHERGRQWSIHMNDVHLMKDTIIQEDPV